MLVVINKKALREKRLEKNYTQHRLSVLAGLPGNAVFRMENTEHKVDTLRITAIANILDCGVEELINKGA